MNKLFIFLFVVFLVLNTACCPQREKLIQALEQSGDNRIELEKVLTHYSQSDEDSLSLKAAIFLIENMPGHYTLDSKFLSDYRRSMDSIYPQMSKVIKGVVYTLPQHNDILLGGCTKVEDLKTIHADYLIQHIDNAVSMWKSCSWLSGISFDDFCEYLLPYRVENEPLLQPDSTLHLWKQVARDMNSYNFTPVLLEDVKSFQRNIIGINDNVYFQNLQTPFLESTVRSFECLDMCFYDVIGFRYAGIPSAIDFIPNWSTRNGRHYWRTMIDPLCLQDNFSETLNPRTGKVYRITYSHNSIPSTNGFDSIPELFQNPFYKDVTNKYVKTTDLTVVVDKSLYNHKPDHIYLAIFNDLAWKPIAWAVNKKGKAVFNTIGRNIIYLPLCYIGKQELPIGYPIMVDSKGEDSSLIPNKEKTITLKMHRKYPVTYSKIHWAKSLIGCTIEASNDANFAYIDTLGSISSPDISLNWTSLPITTDKAYRYWRISKPDRPISLAELKFHDKLGNELTGEPMFSGKGQFNNKAFDGDKLTYCDYQSWVGVDFEKKVVLNDIYYLPRTDGNGITPGHIYELYYFDYNGWISLGKQQAKEQSIAFTKVPSGALYWLQNISEGREERIFTYKDEHIVFW